MTTLARRRAVLSLVLFIASCTFVPQAHALSLTKFTVDPSVLSLSDATAAPTTTITLGFSERAAVTLEILSSSGGLVKTLYTSSGVTNPTPKTWDGTDASGAFVASGTYQVHVMATSTVSGDTLTDSSKQVQVTSSSTNTVPATASVAPPMSSGSSSGHAQPPAITVSINEESAAVQDVPVRLSARVLTKSGAEDSYARVLWSFGDGSSSEGREVAKTYRHAGTYVVTATAYDGAARAVVELTLTIAPATVAIPALTGDGVELLNGSDDELDLSGWRLWTDAGTFTFPDGMRILSGQAALAPWEVMNLPQVSAVRLTHPDGTLAAAYPLPAIPSAAQPAPIAMSSSSEQAAPAAVTKISTAYDVEQLIAPTAAEDPAAVGALPLAAAAALAPVSPQAPAVPSRAKGLLHSPWTLGFFGFLAAAGAAVMIL